MRVCSRCVMDETDPDIRFDKGGVCNNCTEGLAYLRRKQMPRETRERELEGLVSRIKGSSSSEYHCVVGVSGGSDSSYALYLIKKLGLNPLAVHLDNGWNSEVSVKNIEILINGLGVDLHTHVIDWEEFRDLQFSFLKASVPDIEVPTDHAILALLYREAAKRNIKYVLVGINAATESILPVRWAYGHFDLRYIMAIHRQFASNTLFTYPKLGILLQTYFLMVKRIKMISILNYVDYDKAAAVQLLQRELGWNAYGGKHHESIITKFLQGYILPLKFKIDKRKAHLSSLIIAGQLQRSDAMRLLQEDVYKDNEAEEELRFVAKKFMLSVEEFNLILRKNSKSFHDYPNNYVLLNALRRIKTFLGV